ncbi:MAG: DUF2235 domain-containing protein [Dehalococcoidia bacterium]|nr:DUF2235 domain-containing protein [Dehalococcoidia bacterium]
MTHRAPQTCTRISGHILRGPDQCVFYDPGVGTGAYHLRRQSRIKNAWDRLWGGAFGAGLSGNVQDVYQWLSENYQDGDELWFLGFSRGAFTVRSAVGLIRKIGLLRSPVDPGLIEQGYDIYRARDESPDSPRALAFRKRHGTIPISELNIAFVGVWDTVGALGVPGGFLGRISRRRWGFHDHALSSHVRRAYHAVAADELRAPFMAALWKTEPQPGQDVEQVWFAGRHTDVGGRRGDIALRWMAQKAEDAGLKFDRPVLEWGDLRDAPKRIGPLHSLQWRILGGEVTRPIGDPKYPGQIIHASLDELYDSSPDYRRQNMVAWRDGKPLTAPIGRKWWYTVPGANEYYLRQYDDVQQ